MVCRPITSGAPPGARLGRRHSAVTDGLEPADVQWTLGPVTVLAVSLDGLVVDKPYGGPSRRTAGYGY